MTKTEVTLDWDDFHLLKHVSSGHKMGFLPIPA